MVEQALLVSQIKWGSSGEDNLPVQLNFHHFNTYIQICCAYNCGSVTSHLCIFTPECWYLRVFSPAMRSPGVNCLPLRARQRIPATWQMWGAARTQTVKSPLAPTNKQSKGMFTGKSLWTEQQDGGARTTRVWNGRPNKSRHVHERSD